MATKNAPAYVYICISHVLFVCSMTLSCFKFHINRKDVQFRSILNRESFFSLPKYTYKPVRIRNTLPNWKILTKRKVWQSDDSDQWHQVKFKISKRFQFEEIMSHGDQFGFYPLVNHSFSSYEKKSVQELLMKWYSFKYT